MTHFRQARVIRFVLEFFFTILSSILLSFHCFDHFITLIIVYVICCLLDFHLFLVVAILFFLDLYFIEFTFTFDLIFLTVWAPLFVIMLLFHLLSSWSCDWSLSLTQVVFSCCTCPLFFVTELWKWIVGCELVVIFIPNTISDSISDIGLIHTWYWDKVF